MHDLISRVAGREALWRVAPDVFDSVRPALAAYRDPEFVAALAETPGPRHLDPDMELVQDTFRSFATNVVAHLFNGPTHVPATSSEIFKYNIGVRKSLAARARYFVHMLRPTDSDFRGRALPRRLSFAYYLLRPFRLLFRTKAT